MMVVAAACVLAAGPHRDSRSPWSSARYPPRSIAASRPLGGAGPRAHMDGDDTGRRSHTIPYWPISVRCPGLEQHVVAVEHDLYRLPLDPNATSDAWQSPLVQCSDRKRQQAADARGARRQMVRTGRGLIGRLGQALADFVAPKTCPECGERGAWVCAWCEADYEPFSPRWCRRCGLRDCRCGEVHGALAVVRSYGPYRGWVRAAIRTFKYEGETARAPMLADRLIEPADDACVELGGDVVLVPVPLHPRRMRQRGYNQSALLADQLAKSLDLSVDPQILRRVRATRQQVGLSRADRQENVLGAFVSQPVRRGSAFLLVDDVMTTSATLGACASALRAAGASAVGAVTVARGTDTDADLLVADDATAGSGLPGALLGGPTRRPL